MKSLTCVVSCRRCGGRGRLTCFTHVDGGICFQCRGAGIVRAGIRSARLRAGLRGPGIGSSTVPRALSLVLVPARARVVVRAVDEATPAIRRVLEEVAS